MKVALAGAGAFGVKHLEAIAKIDGVEVVSLVGRTLEATREVAARFGVGHVTTDLAESLARPDVDAVILCTPTQMHASQAIAVPRRPASTCRSRSRWPTASPTPRRW